MADLTVTAANVKRANGAAAPLRRTAGATITAGQLTYRAADGGQELSDADGAAALQVVEGIALNGAADGQPLHIHTEGPITIGATLTPGVAYFMSETAGGIAPLADITSGSKRICVGVAKSTSVLEVKIIDCGSVS